VKWIEPPEKDSALKQLEDRLWDAADQLRANSNLTAAQYSQPVLGLIFLRFADTRFMAQRAKLDKAASSGRRAVVRQAVENFGGVDGPLYVED
jgi:type I restriction enzyme M protein